MNGQAVKKVRSVNQYLTLLELSNRSPITIRNYRQALNMYARFLKVPVDQLHENLSVENLIRYAASIKGKSANGRKVILSILHRFHTVNGVQFDELESNVMKQASAELPEDKPLELETIQQMMDQGTPHTRALIAFMVSTGCRAGETSQILLSDVDGDTVTIRPEIAKRRRGGKVYLTSEAREFLDIWLKDRSRFIARADANAAHLYTVNAQRYAKVPRKDTGIIVKRPVNDQRLFACSYSTVDKVFSRLYDRVDGEHGRYRAKCTCHSLRKYFRTHAVKTMPLDVVEKIMRHEGYLTSSYVRLSDEEIRKAFHDGEAALYITRADHRIQTGKLSELERENDALLMRVKQLEEAQAMSRALDGKATREDIIQEVMKRMKQQNAK